MAAPKPTPAEVRKSIDRNEFERRLESLAVEVADDARNRASALELGAMTAAGATP